MFLLKVTKKVFRTMTETWETVHVKQLLKMIINIGIKDKRGGGGK